MEIRAEESGIVLLLSAFRLHPFVQQQITGELLNRELIERHVGIQRADHPVAVAPDLPPGIAGITRAVGIAGQIQPLTRPVLAVAWFGDVMIDELGESIE